MICLYMARHQLCIIIIIIIIIIISLMATLRVLEQGHEDIFHWVIFSHGEYDADENNTLF